MTSAEDRPQMLAEEFERIALAAEREGVRMEFIHGRIGVKAVPDGDHDEIVRWVMEQCMQQRPDLWLYPETGIPVYLLVDRDSCEVLVFSEPEDGRYVSLVRRPFGKTVVLPDPVGISLDTEPFKAWVR